MIEASKYRHNKQLLNLSSKRDIYNKRRHRCLIVAHNIVVAQITFTLIKNDQLSTMIIKE